MTQQERQRHSRRRILTAAAAEFGAHDYDAVTMDSICARHGLSKGLMYHYYAGKEELFLACVQAVFDALVRTLSEHEQALSALPPEQALCGFLVLRERYFQQFPVQKNLFENALIRTPPALAGKIQAMRGPLRACNLRFLRQAVLRRLPLRPGLTEEQVTRYLEHVGLLFWQLVPQGRTPDGQPLSDLHALSAAAAQLLDLVLHGVVRAEAG